MEHLDLCSVKKYELVNEGGGGGGVAIYKK